VTLTVISATNTYVLTVVADTGGAITTPSSSPVIVQYGAATTITASPFPGYGFGILDGNDRDGGHSRCKLRLDHRDPCLRKRNRGGDFQTPFGFGPRSIVAFYRFCVLSCHKRQLIFAGINGGVFYLTLQ